MITQKILSLKDGGKIAETHMDRFKRHGLKLVSGGIGSVKVTVKGDPADFESLNRRFRDWNMDVPRAASPKPAAPPQKKR